jgi:2,6-dihydroxypyridine 3-monooxygenase
VPACDIRPTWQREMSNQNHNKAIIAGGSLGGLMTGIVLEAAGMDVDIYERSPCLIYRALRGKFPNERYHEGHTLNGLSQRKDCVIARFEGGNAVHADMLVGADGSRSFVRQHLMREVKPRYAGNVAWRGVVPESSASPRLIKTFVDHFTFQQMERSHILCYLIPGAERETEPGKRINWVWYWNVPENKLSKLMTGVDGQERDFSLPPGQVRDEWLKKQNAIAEKVFCPQFLELWRATETPFLQPILDLAVPRMVQGRVILLGDAAFIPRPRTAASTAKAGANALALGRALKDYPSDIDAALKEWEPDQLSLGRHLERGGKALGNRSQFGGAVR